MGIVQLAESQETTHAKTTGTGPHRLDPPRDPGRPRRRVEHPPGVSQGRHRVDHLLPLEGPPGGPRTNEQLRVSELEAEVGRLKTLVAELALDRRMLQEALKKSHDRRPTSPDRHGIA